jgi:alpha-L-fucosidase
MPELNANTVIVDDEARLKWFREAKFGLFIHWGLYARLAGYWKGKKIEEAGEHIMRVGKIRPEEYMPLADAFNPSKFNADDWVALAKRAGMKYIVITAKHHDGFAMFKSKASDFNIVDATPYGKDPIKELARACREAGIKLCFYYSQYQDWTDPDAEFPWGEWDGIPPASERVFERYMNRKALPQLTELLTQYGPIGLIWYDTPGKISKYNAYRFASLVHALQPECIVGPRVGQGYGDYIGYGDNQVPNDSNPLPWESPATMNDTWGYRSDDHNWKSVKTLLRLLVSIVSKGGNYLLNVGPTEEGLIPQESIERLEAIGRWMDKNSASVFEAKGSSIHYAPQWGTITAGADRAFMHMFDWNPGDFTVHGIRNSIKRAYLLATGEEIAFRQGRNQEADLDWLTLTLPSSAPDEHISVIALDLDGELQLDQAVVPEGNTIVLPAHLARIEMDRSQPIAQFTPLLSVDQSGLFLNWLREADYAIWEFKVSQAGHYRMDINSMTEYSTVLNRSMPWEGGHVMEVSCGDNRFEFVCNDDERSKPLNDDYRENVLSRGKNALQFNKPGIYEMVLRPKKLNTEKGLGLRLLNVVLTKED